MSREAYFILQDNIKIPKEGKEINSSELFYSLNSHLYKQDKEKIKPKRIDTDE